MLEIVYKDIEENKEYEEVIKKVIEQCYKEENLENSKLFITITLTNPENIQKINKEYRNIDKPTDVLSFPMFEKKELDKKIADNDFEYEDILGDIIISIERVKEQAEEYGHNFEREIWGQPYHGAPCGDGFSAGRLSGAPTGKGDVCSQAQNKPQAGIFNEFYRKLPGLRIKAVYKSA